MNHRGRRAPARSGAFSCIVAAILLATATTTGAVTPLGTAVAQDPAGAIRGVVLETRDGAPVAKVLVRLQDTAHTVTTDEDGRFAMTGVAPGRYELYVSVVDFILVRRAIAVAAGETTEVTIVLTEGAGAFRQSVTVTGTAGDPAGAAAPSAQVLDARELQQLRGLVTNDPFRAIQVLPGVATGDDLRSEFTVRGHAMDHMVFTFEGIGTPPLVHTVRRVADAGSLAMVNGDVLEGVSLVSGAYPLRHGDRLGAELDFRMREGSRTRTQARVSISGTDTALVTEGPIGRAARGSWLASIRKSYLDLITSRIETSVDFTFGFTDAQAKLVYDLDAANQLQVSFTGGRSRLSLDPADIGPDDPKDARNRAALGVLSWRRIVSPRLVLTQRVAVGANEYRNLTENGIQIARGAGRDIVYRADWTATPRPSLGLEGGGELRASALRRDDATLVSATRLDAYERFEDAAVASSAFVQARVGGARWTFGPGVRIDHSTLTDGTSASPWAQASYRVTSALTVRAGTSVARQRPTFDQIVGLRGTRDLADERAYHGDVGVEGRLASGWRWRLTGYTREERDVVRLPDSEYRRVNGAVAVPSATSHFRNSLTGRSRGAELTVERRAVNGFSGWVSYAYGVTRFHDAIADETFFGDYDQRHTVNAYGLYRVSDRFSVSGRFREGSNFPAPGYWENGSGGIFVGATRNDVRVPLYARLDARLNRTFVKRRTRLTLFVEVLNALGRQNVRAAQPGVNRRTRAVTNLFDPLIPRVPSAGLLVEF